jgi:putative ABC transport system permease protein
MFPYYLRLALQSFRRNPGLSALMVFAIALGISVCLITLTGYRAAANNPIQHRGSVLFVPALDGWDPNDPYDDDRPHLQPDHLTYKDSVALMQSDIPDRKLAMYKVGGVVNRDDGKMEPEAILLRTTSGDFFDMFEVPFQHGERWSAADETGVAPVMVISKDLNERAFNGENSIGKTLRWNDREFRIVGVLGDFEPAPKFFDVANGPFEETEDAYVPFGWGKAMELGSAGNTNCWKTEPLNNAAEFLNSECIWIQMWVELRTSEKVRAYREFMDNYVIDQKKRGRFPRPLNNELYDVDGWLKRMEVVGDDRKAMLFLAFAFLTVCLINTVGLMLAKFLNAAPMAGVRRALGASRRDIFLQHLTESGVIAIAGGIAGVLLGLLGLWALRAWYAGVVEELARVLPFEWGSMFWAVGISLLAGVLAGLYPAWRIGRAAPASYLKVQ